MSCKIEHKKDLFKGVESPLGEKLLEIYKDLDKAKEVYDIIASDEFKSRFGDWVNNDITERTNDLYEPKLIEKVSLNEATNYYFLDKNNDPIDLIVREFSSFDSENLTSEIKEITEQIASYIFKKHIKENFDDITSVKKINISNEIKNFVSSKIKENEDLLERVDEEDKEIVQDSIDYIKLIEKHSDEFKTEIINFFNSRKLTINEDIEQEELEAAQDEGLQGSDIKRSIEKNAKDNATSNVKLLLSFLPKYEYDSANNSFEKIYGNALGEELFMSMDVVHKELLTELADIITIENEAGISDVYKQMIASIKKLSNRKPYYKELLNLLDKLSQDKKTQFATALFNTKINYYTTTLKSGSISEYRVFNSSEQQNKANNLIKEWGINFKNQYIQKNKLQVDKLKSIQKDFNKIMSNLVIKRRGVDLNNLTDEEFVNKFGESINNLINGLENLGVLNITQEGFNLFLNRMNLEDNSNDYVTMYNKLQSTIGNIQKVIDGVLKNPKRLTSPFEEYKSLIFKSLSEAEAFYLEDGSDGMVYSGGKGYFTFGKPSFISNTINKYKQVEGSLEENRSQAINKSSEWTKHLLGEDKTSSDDYLYDESTRKSISSKRLDGLEYGVFNSFEERGKSGGSVDNSNISYVDQLVDEINKINRGNIKDKNGLSAGLASIYSTSQAADKATRNEIKIDYFLSDTVSQLQKGNIVFSDKVLNIFVDYFLDELNRMKSAYNELNYLPSDKYTVYYHSDKNGNVRDSNGFLIGNAFKSQIFPELSPTQEFVNSKLNESLQLYDLQGNPLFTNETNLTSNQRKVLKSFINRLLFNRINENYSEFIKTGIAKRSIPNQVSDFSIQGVDLRIVQSYSDEKSVRLNSAQLINLISDYTINSVIAKVEYTKLFTGDPGYYKNMVDFFKRVPATYTDGTNLRIGLTEGDNYFKAAVIENQIVESRYIDGIRESLSNTDITKDDLEYVLSAYSEVNQTDAQAWITPKRWAFLISRLGKWNPTYESVYNKMIGKNNNPLTSDELKYVAQPLKGVYFGVVNGVPTYLKYSQAVLFPQLVKGSQLENLLNDMESNSVDEAITLDGVKVGGTIQNKVTDEYGNVTSGNKFNTITLNNSEWKLQQDLPTKLIKETLLGSQIQKNILNSIDINDDSLYQLNNGTLLTSSELLQEINNTLGELSNKGIENLSLQLGLDSIGRIDSEKFYSMLESELLRRDFPINMVKSIQKNLPIDSIPGIKDKMYNTLFAKIRKAAVKIKTNGGSFIQMSNFGLDKVTADEKGVTWLVEPDQLKPPLLRKDIEGKLRVTPGQIFISHAQLAKFIPNYKELAEQGKLKEKLDKRLLRAIGYRIPNQGMSSNDPLEIVGILPASMGDTIVAYTEIPTKTGSDFDIDKMYIMLPSMKAIISNRTFQKAYNYIKSNDYTTEEMIDELAYYGYTKGDLEGKNLRKIFASEVLLDSESDSEYQIDFLKSIKEGDVETLNYLEFSDENNSKKQLQNKLFELYWSVLTNPKTYADLITPIDFPHLEKNIKSLHGDNSKQTGENLKFYDPIYQLKLKKKYVGGKRGVGITANMLVDHVRSKNINLKFNNYYLGVGHSVGNETVFDQEYSEELNGTKYKISHTISAFLNAFVDNAKDPFIDDGNYNNYTSNVAFMLIRAGVHPDWINAFIGQPVLKELVEFTNVYESKSIPKAEPWKSSFDIIFEKYSEGRSWNEIYDPKTIYGDLESEVFSYKELVDNIKNPSDVTKASNIAILKLFKEYQNQSKKLGESVNLSRFDTEGAGKDNLDLITYINRVKEILAKQNQDGEIGNHIEKYIKNGNYTSLGTQVLNTLEYGRNLLENNPNLFLLSSENIVNTFNEISKNLMESRGGSKGLAKDRDLLQFLNNELYAYILSDFEKFKIDNSSIFIKNTIKDIIEYKNQEVDLPSEEKNLFINSLIFYDSSFGIFSSNMSKEVKDSLYRSFRDLYENNPELTDKIVISLYHQNGFDKNLIDFREFIPHEWFIQNNIRGFFKQKSNEILDSSQYLSSFMDQVVAANFEKDTIGNVIAPKVNKKARSTVIINNKRVSMREAFTIKLDTEGNFKRYILNKGENNRYIFPTYLKIEKKPSTNPMYLDMEDYTDLFKLEGYLNGEPIYLRMNKQGIQDRQNHLNIRNYEYNSNKSSIENKLREQLKKDITFEDASLRNINESFISDNYIKDLTEILKSQENIVSLQKDNNEESPLDCD